MKTTSLSAFFLEILNGGAITPETLWLVLIAIYLARESKRRGLHALNWFNLPSGMNLILAVFICDAGVQIRSMTIWYWRRFNPGTEFNEVQYALLILGGGLIFVGYLCKIRALTQPDYGDIVWYGATIASGAALLVLLLSR